MVKMYCDRCGKLITEGQGWTLPIGFDSDFCNACIKLREEITEKHKKMAEDEFFGNKNAESKDETDLKEELWAVLSIWEHHKNVALDKICEDFSNPSEKLTLNHGRMAAYTDCITDLKSILK